MKQGQIVGIILIKNEDIYIGRIIRNITAFCDQIIVAENYSQDRTYEIVRSLAESNPKIHLRQIKELKESHNLIEGFAGTNTWIFAVDGDEIYDPAGLSEMRQQLLVGTFDDQWCIWGNVLHCVSLSTSQKIAKGYLAPPARSMTKLYNFSIIESWVNCYERLHSGILTFKNGYHAELRYQLGHEMSWEESYFRCLHTVFLKRSSFQKNFFVKTKFDPAELLQLKRAKAKGMWAKLTSEIKWHVNLLFRRDWKNQQYRRGPLVEKDVSVFFPEE